MVKIYTTFQTKKAQKPYPAHTYIAYIREDTLPDQRKLINLNVVKRPKTERIRTLKCPFLKIKLTDRCLLRYKTSYRK